MIVYHEAKPSSVKEILKDGLRRISRGEKSDDPLIVRADMLLDKHRPSRLRDRGVRRDDNIYAYFMHDGVVVDITDGRSVPVDMFVAESGQAVLRLTVDPTRCYVSDLDAYDQLKQAISKGADDRAQERLVKRYWRRVVALPDFEAGRTARPEVMITYDIDPRHIELSN